MIVVDVNVLVYAFREEPIQHVRCRDWVENVSNGNEPFVLPDIVRYGFIRLVTNPRTFLMPAPIHAAVSFVDAILASAQSRGSNGTSERQWAIFKELCERHDVRGNLVPDAYLAALALEANAVLATCDRGFARFAGLRLVDPSR